MNGIFLSVILSLSLFASSQKVTLQLQWLHQFQSAGFYVAKEQGFYREVGLDLTIKELNSSINALDEVLQNRAEYGIARSSIVLEMAKGRELIALGALYQHAPTVLITTDSSLDTLESLRGHKLMVTNNEADGASIMTMFLSRGLLLKDFILQEHSFKLDDLIDGKTDAMACYISNEPFFLDKMQKAYRVFNPRDYGFDFYGDILFTSQKQIQEYPERTQKFYEASIKGWHWAFEHIQESATLLYEKYNTQGKSLESLIYEGEVLKRLALDKNGDIGSLDINKIDNIADFYRVAGLIKKPFDFTPYIDPKGYNKKPLRLGVLAKRGDKKTLKRWRPLASYLTKSLKEYRVEIYPLHFDDIKESIAAKKIDFLLTNTLNYVQLENSYGITRIATIKNRNLQNNETYDMFGGVIFSKKGSHIKRLEDIKGRRVAAVNRDSFGGWVVPKELLADSGIEESDFDLEFYDTHDRAVEALLDGKADVGIVRSDTLERMEQEGRVDLGDFEIINLQKYKGFPYIVSTKLYPEWPFSKLQHVSKESATQVMMALLSMPKEAQEALDAGIGGWSIPLDYSLVHALLKKLRIYPYNSVTFSLSDVLEEYALYIYVFLFFMLVGYFQYMHILKLNRMLDNRVHERTKALSRANKKLQELAHKDSLTGVYSRGYFMHLAQQLFDISKRNKSELEVLSLDIDYFKSVNDNYGHQVGDIVLKLFCDKISSILRESDIFGRIGGEEFVLCLQNTSQEGAIIFANKIRKSVEGLSYTTEDARVVKFTVSIGIATLTTQSSLNILINESDQALYRAKESGRNCVNCFS